MQAYAVSYSKYLISASMVLFTLLAYAALPAAQESRRTFEVLQRLCMAVFTLNAFLTMAILGEEEDLFIFGILLTIIVIWTAVLYRILYKLLASGETSA